MDGDTWYILWHTIIFVVYLSLLFLIRFLDKNKLKLNSKLNVRDSLLTSYLFIAGLLLLLVSTINGFINLNLASPSLLFILYVLFYMTFIVFIEEILFRGIIQTYLVKKTNVILGIFFSSLVFGLAHLPNGLTGFSLGLLNWKLALAAFFGGILFGYSFHKTKSIIYPLILHAILGGILFFLFNGGKI